MNAYSDRSRCTWANRSELMARYHDEEWGHPIHDDVKLFEFLTLETMQAGLSWSTVLNRRESFRSAFFNFDVNRLATIDEVQVALWMNDPSIIRNTAKLKSVITNARAFIAVQSEYGTFAAYQWKFTGGTPIVNLWDDQSQIPATTDLSTIFCKDLKKRGFAFIGPTTCYAHMQATGMVDDHVKGCWKCKVD